MLVLNLNIGGCCHHRIARNDEVPPLTAQPVVHTSVTSMAYAPNPDSAADRRLLAYVSPARHTASAVEDARDATMQAGGAGISVIVLNSESLMAGTSALGPVDGGRRYWDDAVCLRGEVVCIGHGVAIGNGYYRHVLTVNSTACVYSPGGGRCWDVFGTCCALRYYRDAECTAEVPDTEGAFKDWVCDSQ